LEDDLVEGETKKAIIKEINDKNTTTIIIHYLMTTLYNLDSLFEFPNNPSAHPSSIYSGVKESNEKKVHLLGREGEELEEGRAWQFRRKDGNFCSFEDG